MDSEMLDGAPDLKLILTAGVGSDHVDLGEAAGRNTTVVEQTDSNTMSVAEHAVMQILALVRNFIPAYNDVVSGGWSIGEIAAKSHDLENKTVGIYGAGRIGQLIALRLKPFSVDVSYYKRTLLGTAEEVTMGFRYARLSDMLEECDVIVIASPLTEETCNLFNRKTISKMKRGAHIVNIARGAEVERDAVVEALKSGQLGGYAGDVWDPQPAPEDHPWRTMPRHALTPHISGTTLEGQVRYAEDTRLCLEAYFAGDDFERDHVIVSDGEIQSGSYKALYG
ncbi:NAD-dependent formate dehydrogenase [Rubrobacter indicoceani]|uniref:NAD-dependent formate dehydrogenase n=1 Tax=Rubrobacter indicoceani TaxID=2051957 RepID=UPI001F096963|nr:NAD-dependent formate dehydrogenase [Rubrobacter indicoceani]